MMIQYCEKCGSRIEKADLDSGRAVQHHDSMICPTCRVALEAELGTAIGGREATPKKSGADSVHRKATARDAAEQKRTDSTARRMARLAEGETARAEPAPRADGTGRRDRRSDTASRGKAPAGVSPLVIGVGAGILVLVIAGVVLATRSSGPVVQHEEVRVPPPPPPRTTPPEPPPPDPLATELAAFRAEALSETKRYGHLLERAAELAERMEKTPHAPALATIQRDIELRRDRAAFDTYDRIATAAKKLESAGSFDEAIELWRDFDVELVSGNLRSRIDERIGELERLQHAANPEPTPVGVDPPVPDPETLPPPKVYKVGTIPTDGRVAPLLGAGSTANWRIQPGTGNTALQVSPDGFTVDNKGTENVLLFAFDRKKYTWRDIYLACEFQVLAGELTLQCRVPATMDQDKKAPVSITSKSSDDESKRSLWHKLHLVVRAQTCEFWIENESDAQTNSEFQCQHGVIAFAIKPGDRYRIRRLEARVLSEGEAALARVTGVPDGEK